MKITSKSFADAVLRFLDRSSDEEITEICEASGLDVDIVAENVRRKLLAALPESVVRPSAVARAWRPALAIFAVVSFLGFVSLRLFSPIPSPQLVALKNVKPNLAEIRNRAREMSAKSSSGVTRSFTADVHMRVTDTAENVAAMDQLFSDPTSLQKKLDALRKLDTLTITTEGTAAALVTGSNAGASIGGTATSPPEVLNSAVPAIGGDARTSIGGVSTQNSTVSGTVADITTATNSPVSIVGNNSSERIGGVSTQNSTVSGTVADITTATNSPVSIIGNNSSARIGGISTQNSTFSGTVTDITTATSSPVSIIGNNSSARIGGVSTQNSTVSGTVADITTATSSPVSIIGNNSSARIGGISAQNSTFSGTVTDITTATSSPVSVIGNNSSARIGGISIQSSPVSGTVTDITTATNSPVSIIGNNSSARIGGISIQSASSTGQAAVVNQDGTVNSAANPAARGSVISIYATGEGQTSPAGTGSVTKTPNSPVAQVSVSIGGLSTAVQFAGSAHVAGVLQVNAVVPASATSGQLPVVLTIGGVASQASVTIAVK